LLLQVGAVDVLGKDRAFGVNGLLLDGAAFALHQNRALDILAEDGAG